MKATTPVQEHRDRLSTLWKERFEILDGIDGDFLRRSEEIAKKLRSRVSFRVFAFLFTGFYYLVKRMWHKGLMLLILSVLIAIPMDLVRLPDKFQFAIQIAIIGGISAVLATADYYHKVMFNTKVWSIFSKVPAVITSIPSLLAIFIVSIALDALILDRTGYFVLKCDDPEVKSLVVELWNNNYEQPIERIGTQALKGYSDHGILQLKRTGTTIHCQAEVFYEKPPPDGFLNLGIPTDPDGIVNYTISRDERNYGGSIVEIVEQ